MFIDTDAMLHLT